MNGPTKEMLSLSIQFTLNICYSRFISCVRVCVYLTTDPRVQEGKNRE